jgi:hypothetical protein
MDAETLQLKINQRSDEAVNDSEGMGAAALPVLKEALKDKDPEVRVLAISCLSVIDDQQVTGMLIDALGDSDESVYMGSMQILQSKQIDKESIPSLSDHISHREAQIREGVAILLGKFGDRKIEGPLRNQLKDETDPEITRAIKLALARLGDKAIEKEFIKGLHSESPEDRLRSLEDLDYINDKTKVIELSHLFDDTAEAYEIGDPDEPEYTRLCDIAVNLLSNWCDKPFDFEIDDDKIYSDEEIEKAREYIKSLGAQHD